MTCEPGKHAWVKWHRFVVNGGNWTRGCVLCGVWEDQAHTPSDDDGDVCNACRAAGPCRGEGL